MKLVDTRDLKSLGESCTGSSPVRATKSPSSPHHKFSSLTIFVGVAQPFGSSRESLNVIDLCIFLKLFGNANYLQLPALFQKDHSPNLFLSEFRGFFSLSQQNLSQDTVLEQHSLFRGTGYDFLNLVSRASPLFRETV